MVLPYKTYTLRGCAAGQGIWFITSLSQRVYDFVRVCQQGISGKIDLIQLLDEFCLFSKYTKVMTIMYHKTAFILSFVLNRLIKLRVLS